MPLLVSSYLAQGSAAFTVLVLLQSAHFELSVLAALSGPEATSISDVILSNARDYEGCPILHLQQVSSRRTGSWKFMSWPQVQTAAVIALRLPGKSVVTKWAAWPLLSRQSVGPLVGDESAYFASLALIRHRDTAVLWNLRVFLLLRIALDCWFYATSDSGAIYTNYDLST